MAKLPFFTEPKKTDTVKIGTPETGILAIKKLGDISARERIWMRQMLEGTFDSRQEIVKLAERISTESKENEYGKLAERLNAIAKKAESGYKPTVDDELLQDIYKLTEEIKERVEYPAVTITEAFEALVNGEQETYAAYLQEVLEIEAKAELAEEYKNLVTATAILRFRVNTESEPLNAVDRTLEALKATLGEYLGAEEVKKAIAQARDRLEAEYEIWTIEDTIDLHPALLKEVLKFAQNEATQWKNLEPKKAGKDEEESTEPTTEEDLKKS